MASYYIDPEADMAKSLQDILGPKTVQNILAHYPALVGATTHEPSDVAPTARPNEECDEPMIVCHKKDSPSEEM